jgi:hypothetical protein
MVLEVRAGKEGTRIERAVTPLLGAMPQRTIASRAPRVRG